MLRNLRSRRRPRYGAHICALIAALLLLLSVSLLHSRLVTDRNSLPLPHSSFDDSDPLLEDTDPEDRNSSTDDRIDELDDVVDESKDPRVDSEEDEEEIDQSRVSGYYYDHVHGVIRRAFDKRSIDQWEDYVSFDANLGAEDQSKVAFGSDDVPVDENVRRKVGEVRGIEDALLLKVGARVSPLREGWGMWFDAKSDFLRRDRMFKSNLELLNPLNNPLLQDPDGGGVMGLTRGDKLMQKGLLNEFKKVPFLLKKPMGIVNAKAMETEGGDERRTEIKGAERRTLDHNASDGSFSERTVGTTEVLNTSVVADFKNVTNEGTQQNARESNLGQLNGLKNVGSNVRIKSEFDGQVYADGKRWGYFPGLHPRLSFSNFMDAFFRKGKCSLRVFMVWNSPPWMFSVRHQRGLESLLFHHPDACVVVFSESIELNFFSGFVKDGFKVTVAMPNLDEVLMDTPTHIFASVWFEWKKTKFYTTHYSELVRLAALYKYGGIYLDSDIVVLKPLSSLNNTVGWEDEPAGSHLNGAVMAFKKHSPFIMECLMEFYSTYDDTLLRWNGADLLTRVAKNFTIKENLSNKQLELNLQPSFVFFPISQNDIMRYFTAPATETERAQQDDLFKRILNESFTFHFWNSLTLALVPEPKSLVARLINQPCIRCSDVL
ncbi:hypothetical protein LguiA_024786 [Lonicera macranthoides]